MDINSNKNRVMDLSLKIDTVNNISYQDFVDHYFIPQKPLIIKGLIDGTQASEKWNLDYIRQKLGHVKVGVFDNNQKKNTAYTYGDLKMNFGDFIDVIQKDEDCPYRLFLFNGFKYSKELKEDFPCPDIFKGFMDRFGFMFFGGKNTGVRMHYDIDFCNVLHTQFTGRKRVLLFSQEYNDLLYKLPFNTYSIADFEHPDYDKFPGLRYVRGYDVTIEHGDSLFMPAGYWHYFTYLEGGFAVTYRKFPVGIKNRTTGLLNMSFKLWTDKLMSRTLGERWLNYKHDVSVDRANRAINKLQVYKPV